MSMTIRYRIAHGADGDDLRATEADARATLERALNEYVARGHRISRVGDKCVVEDSRGQWVATSELVASV